MAELYDQKKIYAKLPTAQPTEGVDGELEALLAELPPEEREAARQQITAAPTGDDIYRAMQEKNAKGEVFNMNLDQYRLYKAHIKNKETDIIDTMGQAAGGVFDEIMKAGGSIADDPTGALAKFTPSLIEAFAQGTRSLYGMAAQSQDPTSAFFRVKNALSANGDDEQAEFQQFMDAQAFNVHSMRLVTGQDTILMDKDIINPEMTQVMSYIADPTLFVPFGNIAAKGARLVGMGEGLAKASARASEIQRKVLGGAIKWGVGAPIEFLGTATRNTIDFGLEKAGTAFETVTGMPAAEARTTAQMYGWYSASAALEGRTVGLPLVGNIAGAMVGSTTARGVGETLSMIGEQISKQSAHGRGVLSYAGQALRDADKAGVPLSKHARALLNVLDKVDPLFVYSADLAKGAGEGMAIGGALGYLSAGEEGAASGAGAGLALGTAGAGLGAVVADVGNARLYDRIAVQRNLVIEALKKIDPDKASAFEAFAKTAELSGNRDLIAQVDGIITGIDVLAPNAKFVARSEVEHMAWLLSQKIDPTTGRLIEPLALFPDFGANRAERAKALSFLSTLGNRFDGDSKKLIAYMQGLPQDHAMRKQFFRLSAEQKQAVFLAIDKANTPELQNIFGGKKAYEFYGNLNYAEANVARVNAMFDSGNKTRANEMIRQFLKDETVNGQLSERGKLLKDKLATEGYFDKDGNMRPSRLKDVEMTSKQYNNAKGFVFRRDSTGQVEIHINLNQFGKETAPHELFHAIMMDSVMKPDFIDRLGQNLLGKFDANGKMIEKPSVSSSQVKQFFQRYIDALHGKNSPEAKNEAQRLEMAMKEYESRGSTNKISLDTRDTLEGLLEEFGSYYFGAFINDKPVDFLFRGGELGAMREIMGNAKQGFLDFWRSKIKGINPDFNFNPSANKYIFQAFEKDGIRTKNKALDLFMRDFVRATAMANRQGSFDIGRLSPEARETFIRNNGIRGLSVTRDSNGNLVRSPQRKVIQEQVRIGKEIYKILSGLDPKYRQGLVVDGEGNLSGRLSPEAMEAMVQSGLIDRAWVDKIQNAYNILDGKGSNVINFGYLGRTAQIGDYAWPRLVGSDVPFKNRAAVLLDVDFKVGKDGKMYALFHTLDKAVIDGRADVLWSDSAIRQLWNNDRAAMEADFFRYLSNASKASSDKTRVESSILLEDGTGKGAMRRNVLHQMLGMVKPEGETYLNKPIAEIPYGIRHSVTTFNVDGISNMRVASGGRWDVVPQNAFRDLARNFQPSEMSREQTPNGSIIKHPTGYKFTERNGKVLAFDSFGTKIGVYDNIEQASAGASKNYEKKSQEVKQFAVDIENQEAKKRVAFQPIERSTREQALAEGGDLFATDEIKAFTDGTKVVKQTQQEFVAQNIQEMLLPENRAKLNEIIQQSWSRFSEVREIEKELKKQNAELSLDAQQNSDEIERLKKELIQFMADSSHILKDPNHPDRKIIEYYGNALQKQQELHQRMSAIIAELDRNGITNKSSEYWKTKTAFESFENGELNPQVASVFLESEYQRLYNTQYETGVPVTFVANHGTPNYQLIASKMFDTGRLGENTGSQSAKRATFFAGHDTTSLNYVGVPLEPNWMNHPDYAWYFDLDRIKNIIKQNYSNPDVVINNTEALYKEVKERLQGYDTSKGVKNEIEKILAPLEAKSKAGEPLNVSLTWLQRLSNHMVDVGTTFGGYEMDWKDAGRPPHIMRQLVKMTNPFVFEYARSDFRDVTFNEVIMKATEAGHDGVIFKNARDGGAPDIIYALISDKPNDLIKVFETASDGNAVNRGYDDNGKKILNGRELNLLFQPTERDAGGRVYDQNSKEFKSGFIGLWASKNPDRLKGKNIQFFQKEDGSYRIRMQDNSSGQTKNVGHITASISDTTATLSSNIDPEFRGNKLSYALYSEMAERLRAMGVEMVDGQIVNKDGVPIKVREAIIGDTRDYFSGKPISQEEGARRIQERQKQVGSMGGVDVYNRLDKQGRYQPAEGGRTYTQKQMDGEFIGRFASENAKVTKGLKPKFSIFSSGDQGNIELMKGQDSVGYINFSFSKATGEALIEYTRVADKQQGKGYGNLLYSELVERLRSMGMNQVQGMIIDESGRPQKIRERIIDKENARIGGDKTQIDYVEKDPDSDATHTGVTSYLYQKARYQPAEGEHPWTTEIARAQRDLPEDAMKMAQRQLGGGAVGFSIEHAGDILHRTYEYVAINDGFGYNTVLDKVNKVLRAVQEIQKEGFWEVEERNYPYVLADKKKGTGKTWEEHKQVIKDVLGNFAKEHEKLPAYNDLQKTVKTINTSLGRLDFLTAEMELLKLRRKLKSEESWNQYASEGIDAFQQSKGDSSARMQPSEYQGGDDYWKPKKNKFESRDEQGLLVRKYAIEDENQDMQFNPEGLSYIEIGHGLSSLGGYNFKNVDIDGKSYQVKDIMYFIDDKGKFVSQEMHPDATQTHSRYARENNLKQARHPMGWDYADAMQGRIEMPIYEKGKLVRKGIASIIDFGRDKLNTSSDVQDAKELIARKLKINKDDFDLHLFDAKNEIKAQRGYGSKDELSIKFQPRELEVLNITRTQDMPWFRNLIAGGSYVRYAGIEELNALRGLHAVSHGADTLTGVDVTTTEGRRIVEGKGGLGYALNPNNKAAWASIGEGFIKLINDTVKMNVDDENVKQKTALLPLVFTTYRKNLNSVQGSEAFYNIFEILRRGNIVSDKDLRLAMSLAVERLYVDKKKQIKNAQTDALRDIVKNSKYNWDEMLAGILTTLGDSDIQNFGTRGRMVDHIFSELWNRLDLSKSKQDQIKSIFPEWKNVSTGKTITVEDMKSNVANITTDTLSKGLKNGDVYAILKFNDFVKPTESNHRSYDTGVIQENGEKPEIIILKKPITIDDFYQSSVTAKGEKDLSTISDRRVKTNLLGMNARPYGQARVKMAGSVDFREVASKMQPAEGFRDWKAEQTTTGSLIKNSAGFVISRIGSKYRVYNPYKAVIGVFDNEEQAKRRVQREEPKR